MASLPMNIIHMTTVLVLVYLVLRYGAQAVALLRQTGSTYVGGVKALQGR